jgi:hypothetical protein
MACTGAVTVQNAGTVALSSVQLSSTDAVIDGCTPALTTLAAGASSTCALTRTATFAEFEAGSMQIAVAASATEPKGSTSVSATPTAAHAVTLAPIKQVTWSFVRTGSSAAVTAVGEQVEFSVTLENTGNIKWEAGGPLTSTPSLGALVCTAHTPATVHDTATNSFATDHILRVGHKATCTGSFEFTQAVFEGVTGGSKTFSVELPATRPTPGWEYLDSVSAVKVSQSVDVPATVSRSMQGTVIATPCTKPANASGRPQCAAAEP